jgi:hypothetical protein
MNIFTDVHIIYCAIVSPLIFNTIPLIVILFINVILVYKIAIYYKKKQSNASINRNNENLVDVQLTGSKTLVKLRRSEQDQKKLTKFQKSHYSVILFTALWSVLISIPYYTLKSIYLSSSLEFFEGHFHYPTLRITQTISSIFFNFNHCIHFFIYFVFHREFREELLKVIKKLSCKNILSKTNST